MGQELEKVIKTLTNVGLLRWISSKGVQEEIDLEGPRARRIVLPLVDGTYSKLDAEAGSSREKALTEDRLFASLEAAWVAPLEKVDTEDAESHEEITERESIFPWLLEQIEAEGFGGINGYSATERFIVGISDTSECFLGGNGSGKSSLISAIAWGLTGQRINDSSGLSEKSNALHPVYDPAEPENEIGTWGPIASYPLDRDGYARSASVRVRLTFRKLGTEERATIERGWSSATAPQTNVVWPAELEPLKSCLDVAVEMPLKMAHLRLGEAGTLNDAISQLTGLDVLIHVGQLVASLRIKTGRFLNTPKQAEHDQQRKDIERDFDKALNSQPAMKLEMAGLRAIGGWVEKPEEYFGAIDQLKAKLVAEVGDDLSTLKAFVDPSLDLKLEEHQKAVAAAITSATTSYEPSHLSVQMKGTCRLLTAVGKIDTSGDKLAQEARSLGDRHRAALITVANAHRQRLSDPRLGLKAAAARTHAAMHGDAPVTHCPLCDENFSTADLKALGHEIDKLKVDADLYAQTLVSACRAVAESVDEDRVSFAGGLANNINGPVLQTLKSELRRLLIETHAFSKTVPEFGRLFDRIWLNAETNEIPKIATTIVPKPAEVSDFDLNDQTVLDQVWGKVHGFYELAAVAEWTVKGVPAVRKFYSDVLGQAPTEEKPGDQATLRGLAATLNSVVKRARPAAEAIESLTHAVQLSRFWLPNEARKRVRSAICEAIEPLKNLPKYVEAEISRQLRAMTHEIEPLATRFHTAAPFRFAGARLEREPRQRKGLLRARATPTQISNPDRAYELDATLVANSSWMRALLWAFLFAIRQDRAKQLGGLALPLILLDDPQTTFDQEHRCAWIEAVLDEVGECAIAPKPQVLFATHDEHFAMQVDLLLKGFPVRHISPADGPDKILFVSGRILVDRVWAVAREKQTAEACMNAIGEIRKHLELMLKVIFPASQGAKATTLGQLMDELRGKVQAKEFPYNQSEFEKLIAAWSDQSKDAYRTALSIPHHELKPIYDFNFTKKLFAWCLNDLYKAFYNAFEIIWGIQKAGWKLPHVGAIAPFSARKIAAHGWAVPLPANLNIVVGRVAAESDGKGGGFGEPGIRLTIRANMGSHNLRQVDACILTAPTLEPVASVGDVLLLSNDLPPTHNSLVVCEVVGESRARRYSELPGGTAVLVASSVNPRETRRAIVVASGSDAARKVVGIVFRCGWTAPPPTESEVVALANRASLDALLAESEGLVRVVGESAEPIALDGQHLIIGKAIASKGLLARFDGKPIVAVKSDDAIFKRLRLTKAGIVLESIDISGRHPPVVLADDELSGIEFRPVIGVVFDLGQVQAPEN